MSTDKKMNRLNLGRGRSETRQVGGGNTQRDACNNGPNVNHDPRPGRDHKGEQIMSLARIGFQGTQEHFNTALDHVSALSERQNVEIVMRMLPDLVAFDDDHEAACRYLAIAIIRLVGTYIGKHDLIVRNRKGK